MLRKHRADYPATGDRPAATHEDLMVIYRDDGGKRIKAIYFDSEEHVIHYTPSFSKDKETLTFLSEAVPAGPRFRLSYVKQKEDKLAIKFEIAPPGKPDSFKTYVEGTARRKPKGTGGVVR